MINTKLMNTGSRMAIMRDTMCRRCMGVVQEMHEGSAGAAQGWSYILDQCGLIYGTHIYYFFIAYL